MNKLILPLLAFLCFSQIHAQKFEEVSGSIEAVSGIERYKVRFEYEPDLKVDNFATEESFLKIKYEKKEQIKDGLGDSFMKLWFDNRVKQYEPTFIQEFNSFFIENEQVTVAKNITSAAYTMHVQIVSIGTGYSDALYVEAGEIEVKIHFYAADAPDNILYSFNTIVRGNTLSNEFERIRSAYGNLGLAVSKHLSRKALLKK